MAATRSQHIMALGSVALKGLRSGTLPLSNVGDMRLSGEEVLVQSATFMLSCYGHPDCSSLTIKMVAKSLMQYTRSRFYLIRAYAIFDLVVQTKLRVNKRARSYLYRCKKVKLRCKLSDTKKVSSYMISHIDIPFPKYNSIIQKYWYFFKSSF